MVAPSEGFISSPSGAFVRLCDVLLLYISTYYLFCACACARDVLSCAHVYKLAESFVRFAYVRTTFRRLFPATSSFRRVAGAHWGALRHKKPVVPARLIRYPEELCRLAVEFSTVKNPSAHNFGRACEHFFLKTPPKTPGLRATQDVLR